MRNGRRLTQKAEWKCVDCGKDTFVDNKDYYMVTFDLWKKFGVGERVLCIDCMEDRLGHKLNKEDILDCPLNYTD